MPPDMYWSGIPCAVCGGMLGRELLRITQPDRFEQHVGISAQGYWRSWVECDGCGAVTNVQNPANRERLDALAAGYYEVDLAGSSIAEKYAKVMSLPADRSDNVHRVERVIEFVRTWLPREIRPARVLDIGAGTGVFLSRFLERAGAEEWRATAVEPDPVAATHLRNLKRFEVIEDLFSPALAISGQHFVTLNKVVEHLPDPVALLRDAATSLDAARGLLYVELPDKLTIFRRPPSDNILGALHCNLYNPASITRLITRAGLVTLRTERIFEPSGKITVAAFATSASAVQMLASGKSQ